MSVLRVLFPLIRRCPRPLIQGVYRVQDVLDPALRSRVARREGYGQPIPPIRLRRRVGTADAQGFVEAGGRCAEALRKALAVHDGRAIEDFAGVLDFGCGCGRTLQHFYWSGQQERFSGCDVDPEAIGWMQANYDPDRFVCTSENPPLPFEDQSFDLIYLVSVFTHLEESHHLEWLGELRRVLKPGGVLMPTVQSQHALKKFLDNEIYSTADMHRRLSRHGSLGDEHFIYEPYETQTPGKGDFSGIQRTYGLTFIDADYIEQRWTEQGFDLLGIDVGTVDHLQDVVVLRAR